MNAGDSTDGVTDRIATAASASGSVIGRSARFVGRVGALAAALGIGVVLGPLGIASANPDPSPTDDASAPAVTNDSTGRTDKARSRTVRGGGPSEGARVEDPSTAPASSQRGADVPRSVPARTARPGRPAVSAQPGLATPSPAATPAERDLPDIAASLSPVGPVTVPTAPAIPATPASSAAPKAVVSAPAFTPVAAPQAFAAPAAASLKGVVGTVLSPLLGLGSALPVESPLGWAVLAVSRRLGRAEQAPVPVVAAAAATTSLVVPGAATATTASTTTTITWAWGTHPVVNFNPSTDRLDFGWMQPTSFDVTEKSGSTQIAIVGNNHTYTLQGVPVSALTSANIVAKDAGTVAKWRGLLSNAPAVTAPTVSITNATVAEGNSGSSTASFAVALSKAATTTVTVGYTTTNATATAGQDYTAKTGTLTFAPGVTAQTVTIAVTGDTAVEPTETFTVTLTNPTGATLATATATATGTITNDDTAPVVITPPTVSITNATVAEGNSGSSTASFAVALSKAATTTVTVGYTTANATATAGQDYTAKTGTLTFAPGVTAQTVTIAVTGDTAVEPTETFTVTLTNPTGATLATATATGTITNDDVSAPNPGTGTATAAQWGNAFFAPYVDMGGWPVPDLVKIAQANGVSLFTAAFLQATPEGKLGWAGLSALEPGASNEQAQAINQSIKSLQAAGGDVMLSLGGAAGTSLAQWYTAKGRSAQDLANAYVEVVDTYGVNHLDFDIEGAAVAEPASIALNSQALKLFQQARPDVKVWYTLPVLPTGLTADGVKVVKSALDAGVALAGINVMAMDFGESAAPTSGPGAKTMGAYAIASAESTYAQLSSLYSGYGQTFSWKQVGVTPMLGVNDVLSEVFTVADAQALETFARSKGLGMLSMWSITRDVPGTLGQATPTASGLSNVAGSFSTVFNDYGTVNVLKPGTTTGGGTGTPVQGGTTTKITWSWGANTVLSFNPAADKLDFGWMQPTSFDIAEKSGSTQITIVGNNQSYTLQGVALNQMRTDNIIALDSTTVTKWRNAITAAGQTISTPTVTPPTVSVANATVAEGNSGSSTASFAVALSKAATTTVTVGYTTANATATAGQDYTAKTGTLTFAPGVTAQTVTIAVTGDTAVEPTETFTVTLTNPTGATLSTATATGTITNDDTAVGATLPIAAHDKVLAAYFPEWGVYGRNFQIADIPGDQLTHVIYSFLNLTSTGEVALFDSYAAVEKRFTAAESVSGQADLWYYPPSDPRSQQTVWGNFNQLAQLKEKYPHLRVSVALGGWTLSQNFSTVAATAAGREKLSNSIVSFLDTYQMFDGIDFDWEYPGGGGLGGNSASPNDGANYAALLALVRQKLHVLGQQNGRTYEISVASPAGYDKIVNFNLAGLAPSVDFFNLMSYDFHGTWEKTTGHQSAFTGDPNGYDVETAVGLYLAAGVAAEKIVLGAPLYTRAWSGVADGGDGGYLETATGAAPGSFEAGNYDYKDVLAQLQDPTSGWKLYWDDNAQAAYLYNKSKGLFSSFETPTSIAQKSQWADAIGLGGMMFWDISNDAVGSPESLVKAAYSYWVLDQSLATVRAQSSLRGEVITGGDGVITELGPRTGDVL